MTNLELAEQIKEKALELARANIAYRMNETRYDMNYMASIQNEMDELCQELANQLKNNSN